MPAVDVLVIGSGIAGLSAAIKIGQHFPGRKICIVTKSIASESNTQYAQGGISVVNLSNDSLNSHVQDTLQAGDGLCDEGVVRFVVEQAHDRVEDLIAYGVEFNRNNEGQLSLGKEGGHQHNRIVHCKDTTGASVSSALLSKLASLPNITLLTNHAVIDLITEQSGKKLHEGAGCCCGAVVVDQVNGKVSNIFARTTILATGGMGQLYNVTTNPVVATGDGIAIAWRAGAKVSNMEFIQFHPTALASFDTNPCFLISEVVRGHGAHLINEFGKRFMFKYHPDGELACRDIVARAIETEINMSEGNEVYLDCSHIADGFRDKFPTIYNKCLSLGLNLYVNPIPVAPAAHYLCGGIEVDTNARTTINNLYACGECANTGLHGANRLASNSLLEAMVFAHACYLDIARCLDSIPIQVESLNIKTIQALDDHKSAVVDETRFALRKLMTEHVGIVRCNEGLALARNNLSEMRNVVQGYSKEGIVNQALSELRNMVDVAQLIVDQSLLRQENRGGYFNIDLDKQSRLTSRRVVQS